MDSPELLQRAFHYLRTGEPAKCVRVCNEILAESPGLIQAMYLRGCAAFQTGDIAGSVSDLEIVHGNHPEHLHAAYYLGRSLHAAGRPEEALAPLQAAVGEDELTVHARYELATCLARLRRRLEAIDHYQAILTLQPENAQAAANLASLLERENRLDEAEGWTDKALLMSPANETARMTRATLDRRNGNSPEATQGLRSLIPEISNPVNRSIAWNQLGQCLEGQEDWDEAFNAFSESSQNLKKHHTGSRPDPRAPHGLQTLARIQEWLQENPIAGWSEPATRDTGGIAFLVGFPRSGTTLLDRMLQAHPDIEVLEEKSLFSCLHQDWSEPGTLEALADVNEAQIIDARNIYRREMSRHRHQPQRSLVIDKLPLNLAYVFLIHRLFPEAPLIFLQRHPMDVCISCYFQAFELEASMAYFLDIETTAQYYNAIMQVAALSMTQVGNPLHRLRYEDLVAEPKDQLTALLNFLALEWHDSMLEYRQKSSSETSNTPSYQQVSEALYTRSIGRWRHYSTQLESSLSVLQPWAKRFGYQETITAKSAD
ncbi:MAG: tetratricopeptide repeat protein [Gammaproteobacteria bacterium]|nr:tetratricopeptide repeat protein [Gammaproteobacteria bacterium]